MAYFGKPLKKRKSKIKSSYSKYNTESSNDFRGYGSKYITVLSKIGASFIQEYRVLSTNATKISVIKQNVWNQITRSSKRKKNIDILVGDTILKTNGLTLDDNKSAGYYELNANSIIYLEANKKAKSVVSAKEDNVVMHFWRLAVKLWIFLYGSYLIRLHVFYLRRIKPLLKKILVWNTLVETVRKVYNAYINSKFHKVCKKVRKKITRFIATVQFSPQFLIDCFMVLDNSLDRYVKTLEMKGVYILRGVDSIILHRDKLLTIVSTKFDELIKKFNIWFATLKQYAKYIPDLQKLKPFAWKTWKYIVIIDAVVDKFVNVASRNVDEVSKTAVFCFHSWKDMRLFIWKLVIDHSKKFLNITTGLEAKFTKLVSKYGQVAVTVATKYLYPIFCRVNDMIDFILEGLWILAVARIFTRLKRVGIPSMDLLFNEVYDSWARFKILLVVKWMFLCAIGRKLPLVTRIYNIVEYIVIKILERIVRTKFYKGLRWVLRELNWRKGVNVNDFTFDIRPSNDYYKFTEPGKKSKYFFTLDDKTEYSIFLRNGKKQEAVAILTVDGREVGNFFMKAGKSYTIERPQNENKKFKFVAHTFMEGEYEIKKHKKFELYDKNSDKMGGVINVKFIERGKDVEIKKERALNLVQKSKRFKQKVRSEVEVVKLQSSRMRDELEEDDCDEKKSDEMSRELIGGKTVYGGKSSQDFKQEYKKISEFFGKVTKLDAKLVCFKS